MMNTLKHILLATFALAFLTLSCVDPLEPMPKGLDDRLPDKALVFSPSILGSTVVTKAINTGDDNLGELAIETLDVYVYKITSGTGDNAVTEFFKRYHFITVIPEGQTEDALATNNVFVKTAAELTSGTDIILETDWRQAGYDQSGTQPYRIYSIANSRMSGADRWTNLSEADLKAKTITSAETHSGSYDIVRPKDGVGPGGDYYNIHIKDKNFLMDGMIDNWTITVNESQQYFTLNTDKSFPLTRAAAKFIVNVSFDPVFLADLAEEGTVLAPHDEGSNTFSATGAPRFKFSNFMPVTYEVTPTSTPSWRDGNLWSSNYNYDFPDHTYPNPNYDPENPDDAPQTLSGDLSNDPTKPNYTGKATYTLTTYSYSFAWDGTSEGAVNAPALVLRVNYKTGDNPAETFFYRVPLVDLTMISSINRNYLYVVDATISSKGAIIEDIVPMNVNLRYKVIPWPDVIPDANVTEVQGANLLYFTADTEYTLRGDEPQVKNLEYFTPKSVKHSDGHYEYEPKISNIKVYYKTSAEDSTMMMRVAGTPTSPNSPYGWTGSNGDYLGSGVTIKVSPRVDGGGTIDISSNALANRAVKYITFDATVTFTVTDPDTGYHTTSTVTRHYYIKHFPLDNIQSVLGAWSSRWDGKSMAGDPIYKRMKFSHTVKTSVEISQLQWWQGIGNDNNKRKNANSPDNAINGYYATGKQLEDTRTSGSNPPVAPPTSITWNYSTNWWSGNIESNYVTIQNGNRSWRIDASENHWFSDDDYYDYVSSYTTTVRPTQGHATLVKYNKYYYLQETIVYSYDPTEWGDDYEEVGFERCEEDDYNASIAINPDFGIIEETSEPSVASGWVDWDIAYNYGSLNGDTGRTYYDGDLGGDRPMSFYAKYYGAYYGGQNYIYNISYDNSNNSYSGTQQSLRNNHMYIIQVSKADNTIVLGHPKLDDKYQSNDNVVSPAFMIASQLGAIRAYTGGQYAGYSATKALLAARHCGTYMEVSNDGRRFTGWRLPTASEVQYIVGYQNDPRISGGGVFDPVLTGQYYFILPGGNSANTGAVDTDNEEYADGGYFVRCVRDLTPKEVEELNRTGVITNASY